MPENYQVNWEENTRIDTEGFYLGLVHLHLERTRNLKNLEDFRNFSLSNPKMNQRRYQPQIDLIFQKINPEATQ